MTRDSAERIAAGLEAVAALLRESTTEQPQAQRVKLSHASKESGIPVSTLRELLQQKRITATRIGRRWMVRMSDIEAYQRRNEVQARGQLREVAAH